MHSTVRTATIVFGLAMCFCCLFGIFGYEATWRMWNVPALTPHFADLRAITHGGESVARGYDPMVSNPGDPWGRRLSYPRIWQRLYSLGIDSSDTTWLGIGLIVSFLVGVVLLIRDASNATIAVVCMAVLSPATLLAIERANTDLVIFFLAACSALVARRSASAASLGILFGFVLKVFPIFEVPLLLNQKKNVFALHAASIAAVSTVCILANAEDLKLISSGTPRGDDLSYGVNVAWMRAGHSNPGLAKYSWVLWLVLLAVSLCVVIRAFRSRRAVHLDRPGSFDLDCFRLGAGVYVGTFLLGNNWDYRLIFLIFTIPCLMSWSGDATCVVRLLSRLSLGCVLISMWYLVLLRLVSLVRPGRFFWYVIDESCNWALFGMLLYLLVASLPEWVDGADTSGTRATG